MNVLAGPNTVESLLRHSVAAAVFGGMLYSGCVLLAIALWRACRPQSPMRCCWLIIAAVIAVTAVIEALGLPTSLAQTVRVYSIEQGWYARRWNMQIEYCTALVAVCLTGAVFLKTRIPAFSGLAAVVRTLGVLLIFIALRSISLHELDAVLGLRLAGQITVNSLVEGGLLCILLRQMLRAWRL